MKNNQKVIIVSAGLIILGLYYFYKQSKQNSEIAKETTSQSGTSNTTPAKADWDKVLKKGSVGKEVEILQTALKQLTVDGNFGLLTEDRLKRVMKVTETSLNQYNKFIKKK
jgi:hypothetical protein